MAKAETVRKALLGKTELRLVKSEGRFHGLADGKPMLLTLNHRKAISVRPKSAFEQRISIKHEVLRSDGCGEIEEVGG